MKARDSFWEGSHNGRFFLTGYPHGMGTVRNHECERMDEELRRLFSAPIEVETRKDEYSEDFIVWVTVNEELHSIRVTVDEYRDGCWTSNVLMAIAQLAAQDTNTTWPA